MIIALHQIAGMFSLTTQSFIIKWTSDRYRNAPVYITVITWRNLLPLTWHPVERVRLEKMTSRITNHLVNFKDI